MGGTPASLGAQTASYEGALARSLAKYHNVPLLTYLICDSNRGYTPEWIKLYGYSLISQGITGLDLFSLALMECCAIGYPETLKALKEMSYTIGDVENYLVGAKVKPAQIAIGWSSSTDIWDVSLPENTLPPLAAGNNIYPTERHCLYYILRHLQYQVDILSEEDLTEGYLKNYKVYFWAGDHISPRAAEALRKWVEEGGILVSVAGGGFYDNYNQAQDILKKVYGIKNEKLEKVTNWMRPKLELLHTKPIDSIRFDEPSLKNISFDAYAYKQSFDPDTARVLGSYEDGKAAFLCNSYGKGKAFILGALTGFAYAKPAIPLMPYGRSSNPQNELSFFIPTAYSEDVRRVVSFMLESAGIDKTIESSVPLVEGTLMECQEKNTFLVPLINHSLSRKADLKVSLNMTDIKSISARKAGNIEFKEINGKTTFSMPIDDVDFLVIKK